MSRRAQVIAAARGVSVADVAKGLPVPEHIEGQLEIELPEPPQRADLDD